MLEFLLAIVILGPLSVYLVVAIRRATVPKDPAQFFNARQSISAAEFAGSSTVYNFQTASIVFFTALSFLSPLLAILNTFLWAVGILLLLAILPKIADHLGTRDTLFQFLEKRYGSPAIRFTGSIMAILGFFGLLLAELIWGTSVLSVFTSDQSLVFFSTFILGIFLLVYFAPQPSGY